MQTKCKYQKNEKTMASLRNLLVFQPLNGLLRLKNKLSSLVIFNTKMYSTEEENDAVVVDKVETITTIGINRPHVRNCINQSTGELLKTAIDAFENDNSSPVAVLYGIGGTFCAGYDLRELSSFDKNLKELPKESESGHMGPTRRFIKKPIIAAVSGYAVAGGLELALMCDLRVVEENAIMGVFCRRFGVPLLDGGTVRLQALIGLSRALDMILTGRPVDAKEAFEWGLANRVVATGTGFGQAIQLAISIAKFPQQCLLADRLSAYQTAFGSKSLEDSLDAEKRNAAHVVTAESIAGASKFVKQGVGRHGKFTNIKEREKPDWEINDNTKTFKNKL